MQSNLSSVNYLLWGAPKLWWTILPKPKFEEVMMKLYGQTCPTVIRHSRCFVNPDLLREKGVIVHAKIQRAGEFIVTHPLGYHSGFSTGPNAADARNISVGEWERYYRMATCECNQEACTVWTALRGAIQKFGVGDKLHVPPSQAIPMYQGEDGWIKHYDPIHRTVSWIPKSCQTHHKQCRFFAQPHKMPDGSVWTGPCRLEETGVE